MEFTKDSALVQTWVRLIHSGTYTREQVPSLGNLPAAVAEALDPPQA